MNNLSNRYIHLNFGHRLAMLFAWVLFIVVMLLSPMPEGDAQASLGFADKLVHGLLFGVLTFLVFFLLKAKHDKIEGVLNPERSLPEKKKAKKHALKTNGLLYLFLIPFIVSLVISIVLEYAQIFVPGRSASDYDFIAGLIATILVLIFIYGSDYSQKKT